MKEIVFLLEEPSAEAMLRGLLPKLVPEEVSRRFIVFEGKQDLEKQLVMKIKAYRNPLARFVVLRDQDANTNCVALKAELKSKCDTAGRPEALVRIACRELESFYLADLAAVEKGLDLTGLSRHQLARKFRAPDHLVSPSTELATLTGGRYQKIGGSRAIGPWLDLENSRSRSFQALVAGIRRVVTAPDAGSA